MRDLAPVGALLGGILVIAAVSALVGRAVPLFRLLGLDVIGALVVPSYLAHIDGFDRAAFVIVDRWFNSLHVLDWFIAVIVTGSLVSLDLRYVALISARMVVPVVLGSILAAAGATLVGTLYGFTPHHTLFYLAIPVMAGGLTAGAIPLALGYASITDISAGSALAAIFPPVIIGNLIAVMFAGLHRDGSRQVRPDDETRFTASIPVRLPWCLGALALLVLLRSGSQLAGAVSGIAAVLVLMAIVVVLQVGGMIASPLRAALVAVYRWCLRYLTFPILALVGLLVLPWDVIITSLNPATLLTVATIVLILTAVGRLAASRLAMDRGEAATIMLARAAMGGTGNIAILRAAQRIPLMPITQLATRLGGALTVAVALATLTLISS